MAKYIPLNKRTKKQQKEYNSKQRVLIPFDTSTRSFKTDKHPSRARRKMLDRKEFM